MVLPEIVMPQSCAMVVGASIEISVLLSSRCHVIFSPSPNVPVPSAWNQTESNVCPPGSAQCPAQEPKTLLGSIVAAGVSGAVLTTDGVEFPACIMMTPPMVSPITMTRAMLIITHPSLERLEVNAFGAPLVGAAGEVVVTFVFAVSCVSGSGISRRRLPQ
jgi:hypothetical protein